MKRICPPSRSFMAGAVQAELEAWRTHLIDKGMKPVTFNRLRNNLRAALELAAGHRSAIWKKGLAKLGTQDEEESNNVVLSDAEVLALVRAAYQHDRGLGLLCDVLAETGARPGQAVRLQVKDLRADPSKPRLDMPRSGKGGGRDRAKKKTKRYAVSITPALALKLGAAAKDRPSNAPLLLRGTGKLWIASRAHSLYRRDVRAVVASIGLDPDAVTLYALRHSSITRMLLKNVPVRIIAAAHDTSIRMIEKHYSVDIDKHSDDWTRSTLLHSEPTLVAAE
jgi:integrase